MSPLPQLRPKAKIKWTNFGKCPFLGAKFYVSKPYILYIVVKYGWTLLGEYLTTIYDI
jgi:hypothetical protein